MGLPGILFTFLSGMLMARKDFSFLKVTWTGFVGLLALFAFLKYQHSGIRDGIHINVCIGFLASMPFTAKLSRYSPKITWDRFLGTIAYPLFLVHPLVRDAFFRYSFHPSTVALLCYSTLAAALINLIVERPFDLLRYKVRNSTVREKDAVVAT